MADGADCLKRGLLALAEGWEHGDAMVMRARYAKPSEYAAALREVLASAGKNPPVWVPEQDAIRDALRSCVDELERRSLGRVEGNAPGHGHLVPGVWDDDNGTKAGTRCEWCAAWPRIRALAGLRCSRCGGSGRWSDGPCDDCLGSGRLLPSGAPAPHERPSLAPVHYLAHYASGHLVACDPTIKDGWTSDPGAVTCEECRRVIRWRCEVVPPASSEEMAAPAVCKTCGNYGCAGDVSEADRARCKTLNPGGLRCFTDDVDTCIAASVQDALAVMRESQGADGLDPEAWGPCLDDEEITIHCDPDGNPATPGDPGIAPVTKTAAEWAKRGRGFLCTTEF